MQNPSHRLPEALELLRFGDWPAWPAGDPAPALSAFRRSATKFLAGAVETGSLGLPAEAFRPAAQAALAMPGIVPSAEARAFFETNFRPARLKAEDPSAAGFVTGYYEPVVAASLTRTERFHVPLYGPPADLAKVEAGPDGLDPGPGFARRLPDGRLAEYFDRAAIETGALRGRGLEIAWLDSAVDAFFVHVQGSARLALEDGSTIRVGYAAKSGHRFTAVGRILVAEGELTLETADMDGIRRWLAAHPDRADALLRRNRSFIFFRIMPVTDEADGPVGAADVALTPLASLAVDRSIHTFGTPVFVDAPTLEMGGAPFARLLVAQDTGSAIVGPQRGDVFVGSGAAAGQVAGRIRDRAAFSFLVPAALVDAP